MDKETILAKFGKSKVYSKDIDGTIYYIRAMTVGEKSVMENDVVEKRVKADTLRQKLLVKCLCDESGNRLFEDKDEKEIAALSMDVEPLVEMALVVNGFAKSESDAIRKN